jgi:hypothetical protein
MTTASPQGSSLSTECITAYVDTLLCLTKGLKEGVDSSFDPARIAFIRQLTDQELDHVVGTVIQLDLPDHVRFCYREWLREYISEEERVIQGKCTHNNTFRIH